MERRRVAFALAGLVVVGGAVVALRLGGGTQHAAATATTPSLPTSIHAFAAAGVLAPGPGDHPDPPGRLTITTGPHRLQVGWGSAVPGGHDPRDAVGYDVRWGTGGQLDHERLTAQPAAELDGLPDDQDTRIGVRAIDAFGQRSDPATGSGRPGRDDRHYALVDRFDGPTVPDPRLWQLSSPGDCARADRGTGDDARRLIITGACGGNALALRCRAPLRLDASAPGGELGRFTVDTDTPGQDGELDLDLVPGPADLIDDSPNEAVPALVPNVAADDPALPPGTIRVRILGNSGSGPSTTTVQVLVGPGMPRIAVASQPVHALPLPLAGISVRWDVLLRTDGIRVLRNGIDVGGGNVIPQWTAATALVGLTGPSGGSPLHTGVAMIALSGAPTDAPAWLGSPGVRLTRNYVDRLPAPVEQADADQPIAGLAGGQLRLTLYAQSRTVAAPVTVAGAPPAFEVEVHGQRFAATPAVPGTALLPQTRFPLVATLPAAVLAVEPRTGFLPVRVLMDVPGDYTAQIQVVSANLELTARPGARPPRVGNPGPGIPLTILPPHLAVLTAQVLDAGGSPAPPGQSLPRGRLILDVSMDGPAGQRLSGPMGGLAGFRAWLDGTELVAVPTAVDGPGLAGNWRVAFDPSSLRAGVHTIDIRAFSTDRASGFGETFVNFQLGP